MGNVLANEADTKQYGRGTLRYFPIRGRGEPIRLTLALAEVEWSEELIDYKAMKGGAGTEAYPFGQCPIWVQEDGEGLPKKYLSQMDAITRFLGRRYGLYETGGEWEAARCDEVMVAVESIRAKYVPVVYAPSDEAFTAALAEYEKLHVAPEAMNERCGGAHLGLLDAFLGRSETEWVAGTPEPTIADVQVFDVYDINLSLLAKNDPDKLHAQFPRLAKHYKAFSSIPQIAEYLKSPKRHAKINNSHRG